MLSCGVRVANALGPKATVQDDSHRRAEELADHSQGDNGEVALEP